MLNLVSHCCSILLFGQWTFPMTDGYLRKNLEMIKIILVREEMGYLHHSLCPNPHIPSKKHWMSVTFWKSNRILACYHQSLIGFWVYLMKQWYSVYMFIFLCAGLGFNKALPFLSSANQPLWDLSWLCYISSLLVNSGVLAGGLLYRSLYIAYTPCH